MVCIRDPNQWQLVIKGTTKSLKAGIGILFMCCHCTALLHHFWRRVSSGRRKLIPTRGLHSDVASLPESVALKKAELYLMLREITNCVVISQNGIMKKTAFLAQIWQKIREH